MMSSRAIEELLILTKTYPNPSSNHRETTCVAAFDQAGQLRRLYPVPFRLLDGEHQFKKWEWIRGQLASPRADHRPESRRIDIDTVQKTGREVGTENAWAERRRWIEPHVVAGMTALELRRQETGQTLGFIRPTRILSLEITPVKDPDWTDEDKKKLLQEGLFDSEAIRARAPLRKLPFDFHYIYECATAGGPEQFRHKITDWEAGALFWNCRQGYGDDWEGPFRQKLETEFSAKDLLFLMGTVHRFPDQWLIVGLVYPPKPLPDEGQQLSLGLGH